MNDNGNVTDVIMLELVTTMLHQTPQLGVFQEGLGHFLRPSVRNLTINNRVRFTDYNGEELVDKGENGLQYCVVGYNQELQADFQDLDQQNIHL